VGQCYRSGRIELEIFEKDTPWEKLLQFHVKKGFSRGEAMRLTRDRRAFLAVPIKDEKGETVGVIYCDSDDPEVFSALGSERAKELLSLFSQVFGYLLKLPG